MRNNKIMWCLRRYLLAFITCFLIACFLLIGVNMIPSDIVRENIQESMAALNAQGEYSRGFSDSIYMQLDDYTEAHILHAVYLEDSSDPIHSAFYRIRYWSQESFVSPLAGLTRLCNGYELPPSERNVISTYWLGAITLLRPLLSFLNYMQARQVLIFLVFLTFFIASLLLWKRGGWRASLSFFIGVFIVSPYIAANLFHTGSIWLLTFVVCIFVAKYYHADRDWGLVLFVAGIFTAFFDWLSTPIVAYGLPVFFIFAIGLSRGEFSNFVTGFKLLVQTALAWIVGYGLMLFANWGAASAMTGINIFEYAFGRVQTNTSEIAVCGSTLLEQIRQALNLNFYGIFPLSLFYSQEGVCRALVLLLAVLFLFVLIAFNQEVFRRSAFYIFPVLATAPLGWYLVVNRHSCIHFWFTYRGMSVFAVCMLFFYFLCIDFHRIRRFYSAGKRWVTAHSTAFRFLCAGAVTTGLDLLVYFSLLNYTNLFFAKAVSVTMAIVASYFINKNWTFQYTIMTTPALVGRYLGGQVLNIAVNSCTNYVMVLLTNSIVLAFVIATSAAMVVNYFVQNKFVFRKNG